MTPQRKRRRRNAPPSSYLLKSFLIRRCWLGAGVTVPAGAPSPAETTEIMVVDGDQRMLLQGGPAPSERGFMCNMSDAETTRSGDRNSCSYSRRPPEGASSAREEEMEQKTEPAAVTNPV